MSLCSRARGPGAESSGQLIAWPVAALEELRVPEIALSSEQTHLCCAEEAVQLTPVPRCRTVPSFPLSPPLLVKIARLGLSAVLHSDPLPQRAAKPRRSPRAPQPASASAGGDPARTKHSPGEAAPRTHPHTPAGS